MTDALTALAELHYVCRRMASDCYEQPTDEEYQAALDQAREVIERETVNPRLAVRRIESAKAFAEVSAMPEFLRRAI